MTDDQARVLQAIRQTSPEHGILTGSLARMLGKPTYYVAPKLKALARLGYVRRHETRGGREA